jgi:hypothetical protein
MAREMVTNLNSYYLMMREIHLKWNLINNIGTLILVEIDEYKKKKAFNDCS